MKSVKRVFKNRRLRYVIYISLLITLLVAACGNIFNPLTEVKDTPTLVPLDSAVETLEANVNVVVVTNTVPAKTETPIPTQTKELVVEVTPTATATKIISLTTDIFLNDPDEDPNVIKKNCGSPSLGEGVSVYSLNEQGILNWADSPEEYISFKDLFSGNVTVLEVNNGAVLIQSETYIISQHDYESTGVTHGYVSLMYVNDHASEEYGIWSPQVTKGVIVCESNDDELLEAPKETPESDADTDSDENEDVIRTTKNTIEESVLEARCDVLYQNTPPTDREWQYVTVMCFNLPSPEFDLVTMQTTEIFDFLRWDAAGEYYYANAAFPGPTNTGDFKIFVNDVLVASFVGGLEVPNQYYFERQEE